MSDRYTGVVVELDSSMQADNVTKYILLNRYVACAIPVLDRIFVSFNEPYRAEDMEETIQQFLDIRGVKSVEPEIRTLEQHIRADTEYFNLAAKLNECCVDFCGDYSNLTKNKVAGDISRAIYAIFDIKREGQDPEKVLKDFLQTLKRRV